MDTPNRLNDITIILTRMRRFRFIFAGDISEMFLQIRLHEDHRFIHEGKHYQFKRVLFGNKGSPNISQKALSTLCSQYADLTEGVTTLSRSCYMDDCIDSRETERELVQLSTQLPIMLQKGGMKICKMFTNSPEPRKTILVDLQAKTLQVTDHDDLYEEQKVLGMAYCVEKDNFTFNVKHKTLDDWKLALDIQKWTKRNILKITASHYDPLGLVCPITILPRRLMQEFWTKVGWDEILDLDIVKKWEDTLTELLKIQNLHFKRHLQCTYGLMNGPTVRYVGKQKFSSPLQILKSQKF